MRVFTADELSRMQATQVSAMQDVCIVQAYSRTLDTYGAPVETWTDGSPIACGVEMTTGQENRRPDLTAEYIDATIRLPIGTSIKATDHVKVTTRFGVVLGTAQVYEVIGEIRRGPSGLQVDLQEIIP